MQALVSSSLAIIFLLSAGSATAQVTKLRCVNANANAQDRRRDGHFGAARQELQTCIVRECPPLVREDCARRLEDLEQAQPTIIFDVKDANGRDVSPAFVSVDGAVAEGLSGRPLDVDPGSHVFKFTSGPLSTAQTFVVTEGDKGRREHIVLDAGPPPPPSRPPPGRFGVRETAGLVIGGAGVVSIIVGSVFGGLAISEVSSEKSACSPGACPDRAAGTSDRSSAETDASVSTATFIVGGALVATGLYLLLAPHSSEPAAAILRPSLGPGGGGLVWQGTF